MIAYPFVGVWKRTVDPTIEPVSVEEVKEQCRIVINADDAQISRLIEAARGQFEEEIGRKVCRATWQLVLDEFPNGGEFIELPSPPLISVSSIVYTDTDGVSQTVSPSYYAVSTAWEPGRIRLTYGYSWPSTRDIEEAVTITYLAGYATAAEVPANWKHPIRMLVSDAFENDSANAVIQGGAFVESRLYRAMVNSSRWC